MSNSAREAFEKEILQKAVYKNELGFEVINPVYLEWLEAPDSKNLEKIAELNKERKQDAIDGQCTLDELNNKIAQLEARIKELENKPSGFNPNYRPCDN